MIRKKAAGGLITLLCWHGYVGRKKLPLTGVDGGN